MTNQPDNVPSNEPDNEQLTPFERTLATQLRAAGGGFRPDAEVLVDGGLRRGRARLWRRRAATVTGAVAVAGVAVLATQLPGGSGKAADGDGVAATAGVPETEAELTAAVRGMLPEDVRVARTVAVGVDQSAEPVASFVIESGEASYTLEVALSRGLTEDWGAHAGCAPVVPDEARCEESELPDGSVRSVTERDPEDQSFDIIGQDQDQDQDGGGASESGDDGALRLADQRSWSVRVESPTSWGSGKDGLRRLTVDLAPQAQEESPRRAAPLSEAELVALSEEPVWQRLFDRADVLHGAPEEPLDPGARGVVPSAGFSGLFRELAPNGLTVTDRPNQTSGGAVMSVADGVATARVEVSGQVAESTGLPGEAGETPEGCQRETLEDGTQMFLCAGEGGAAETRVDVHYPDGASLLVLVRPVAGGDSPLTEDQLLDIARDSAWLALLG
ncbi:hypothetical protein [Streptomyces sedi]|uniref:Uncharacterized protein n=1 Tax=Streptomyces sedi TaxID=555059 RepID=A0A5C4V8K0_9ACTN|nr:hypothetical protein [Streptomyces sedi]TNM32213.1 hypothetical protein FH715_07385 [Streptomyces sedi]